jgi:hypothetical protein
MNTKPQICAYQIIENLFPKIPTPVTWVRTNRKCQKEKQQHQQQLLSNILVGPDMIGNQQIEIYQQFPKETLTFVSKNLPLFLYFHGHKSFAFYSI